MHCYDGYFFFYPFTFRLCPKCHINPDSNLNSNVAAGIQTVLEGGLTAGTAGGQYTACGILLEIQQKCHSH